MTGRVETGRVIERYVVEGELGQGGMASVYLLRHRHLGTQHALKVLTTVGANAELRLLLEGRVQAALRHPNVVAVTDILDVDGRPGLLMEYIPPPSLAVWLAGHQPTVEEAEALFRGIVEGVRHAHRYGLVHRDLKPSNVLLARYDEEGLVPKVADFGLAKVLSTEEPSPGQTRSGLTMGTPQYMAPEQFRDAKNVDRRADMFSLGCILYELLSGRPPFAWSDLITLYNQIATADYPPLPEGTPQRLVEAVTLLMQPEREARLPDCEALLAVLDGKGPLVGVTVTPENLGQLVDVPMLRDRLPLAPAPAPVRPASPASATLVSPDSGPAGTLVAPESLPTPPAPTIAAPVAPRTATTGALAWLGAGAVLAAVAGLGWAVWPSGAPSEGPAGLPEPAPVAPAPAELPPAAVEVTAPTAVPVTEARPVGRPAGEPVAPVPAPAAAVAEPTVVVSAPVPAPAVVEAPAATGGASVAVEGDASRVVAVGAGGSFPLPGELPAGSYDLFAWFPDSPRTKTARVTVAAGERLTVRCTAFSLSCGRH